MPNKCDNYEKSTRIIFWSCESHMAINANACSANVGGFKLLDNKLYTKYTQCLKKTDNSLRTMCIKYKQCVSQNKIIYSQAKRDFTRILIYDLHCNCILFCYAG